MDIVLNNRIYLAFSINILSFLLSIILFELYYRHHSYYRLNIKYILFIFWIITRLGGFFTLYILFDKEPISDVSTFYLTQARKAISGDLVYRDFASNYGPLFPYIAGIAVSIFDSAKSIILLSIVFDGLAFLTWLRLGERLFQRDTIYISAFLYLFSGHVITYVILYGQNQVWLSFALALSLLLLHSGRNVSSGVTTALGLLATKFLFLIAVPSIFYASRDRLHWTLAFLIVAITGHLWVSIMGGNILMPILRESSNWTSGNIPYLLTLVGLNIDSQSVSYAMNLLLVFLLISIFLCTALPVWKDRHRLSKSIYLVTLCFLTLLTFGIKSYSFYLVIFYFPLVICLASRISTVCGCRTLIWGLGFFNLVASIEFMAFYALTNGSTLLHVWTTIFDVKPFRVLVFTGFEISLVLSYIFIAIIAYRNIQRDNMIA